MFACLRSCFSYLLCIQRSDAPVSSGTGQDSLNNYSTRSPTKQPSGRIFPIKGADQSLGQIGTRSGSFRDSWPEPAAQMTQPVEPRIRSHKRTVDRTGRRRRPTVDDRERANLPEGSRRPRSASFAERQLRAGRRRRSRYRKHRSRSPSKIAKRREGQPPTRIVKNVQELYDKQLPKTTDQFTSRSGYKFVSDTYTPTLKNQSESPPGDQSNGSPKSPEKVGLSDADKDETEKNSTLSRQIPIIKVVGDLQEVPMNVGKIPTYKSDGLMEQKPKMISKDVFKHFDKEFNKEFHVLVVKKEVNQLKTNFDLKEVKPKRSFEEEFDRREPERKEYETRKSTLAKNLAILKEVNLDSGPRKIEYRTKLKSKESKTELLVGHKSDERTKKNLEPSKAKAPDWKWDRNLDLEMSNKSNKSVTSQSSQTFGSSGMFNVNSLAKALQKDDSNSSINPFNSLRIFIKKERDFKLVPEKKRILARQYLKDDFGFKEIKCRRSPERNSLGTVTVINMSMSGEKIRNVPKSDSKDEKTASNSSVKSIVKSSSSVKSSAEDGKASKEGKSSTEEGKTSKD